MAVLKISQKRVNSFDTRLRFASEDGGEGVTRECTVFSYSPSGGGMHDVFKMKDDGSLFFMENMGPPKTAPFTKWHEAIVAHFGLA